MNLEQICAELEKNGFRQSDALMYPFEYVEKSAYSQSFRCQNNSTQDIYSGTLYQKNEIFKDRSFVLITRLSFEYSDSQRVRESMKWLLFTDAPREAEYEKAMNASCQCESCGKEDIKKSLLLYSEKRLCAVCYGKAVYEDCFRYHSKEQLFKALENIG